MCTTCQVNTEVSAAFAESLLKTLNSAATALMLSIGHRTGLFDTMARAARPLTSMELAEEADLQERYVREWLGAMATAHIVRHDAEECTYWLPPEHAAFLTRDAGSDNIATPMQWVAVLGGVEDEIVECFRKGGGVPYERFRSFHRVMAEESNLTVVNALFNHILPLVPGLLDRLREGITVADLGCGSGWALCALAHAYPKSRFVGVDISVEAIERARARAAEMELRNVRFEVADAARWDATADYDAVFTFDAIHDQANPAAVLSNIRRALRPGGVYLMQDIAGSSNVANNMNNIMAPFTYTVSTMHCMTVSLAQGGMGLGAAWGEELALEMLGEAGFCYVDVKKLDHDFINSYYVCRA